MEWSMGIRIIMTGLHTRVVVEVSCYQRDITVSALSDGLAIVHALKDRYQPVHVYMYMHVWIYGCECTLRMRMCASNSCSPVVT